jgi:histone deacetylase complex regulatory component SIN3
MQVLNKNIIGIGCNAHILSSAINIASSLMNIDVEVIISQIYLYFHRFTVRVASFKQFCEEVEIEYRKLLGYLNVRWLSVTPVIERIIHLFEPLCSYFLSINKCPKVLKDFFLNDLLEITLYFVDSQASIFHKTADRV